MNERSIHVRASSSFSSTTVDGEEIILDLDKGVYYGLNEVGARIWKIIQTKTTVTHVCRTLEDEYRIDSDRCREDVMSLLKDLHEAGLAEIYLEQGK